MKIGQRFTRDGTKYKCLRVNKNSIRAMRLADGYIVALPLAPPPSKDARQPKRTDTIAKKTSNRSTSNSTAGSAANRAALQEVRAALKALGRSFKQQDGDPLRQDDMAHQSGLAQKIPVLADFNQASDGQHFFGPKPEVGDSIAKVIHHGGRPYFDSRQTGDGAEFFVAFHSSSEDYWVTCHDGNVVAVETRQRRNN